MDPISLGEPPLGAPSESNLSRVLALFERELRVGWEDPDMIRETTPELVRLVRTVPPMGFIRYSRLDPNSADETIREQIEYFRNRRMPFEWEVFDQDTPPDLMGRLLARGFRPTLPPDDPGAVLVFDLGQRRIDLPDPGVADVRRIEQARELGAVRQIEEDVWGTDFGWLEERLARHLEIPGYLSVFLARVDGQPVSCGWTYTFTGTHFAGLRGGATLPGYRGRGLYRALLAARAQKARADGVRYLVVDAAPASRAILERAGFQLLTHAIPLHWSPEQDTTPP